jgi:hypothetical protein
MDKSIRMTIETARSRGVGLRKMWEEVIAASVGVNWRLRMWVEVKELKQQKYKSIMKFVSRLKQYFVLLNVNEELVDAKVTLKKTVLK